MPGVLDHLIVFILVIASPIDDVIRANPRFRRALAAGAPRARLELYRTTIALQWLFSAAVLALWWWTGRAWGELGLGLGDGWRVWAGAGLAVLAIAVFTAQARAAIATPAARASVRSQIGPAGPYVPRSDGELRLFYGVSVTAGICEELLFRGFLLWYLTTWLPMAAAVPLAAVCFGLAHLFGGRGGVVRAGVAGLALSGVYLLLDSLWAAMVIHAVIDVTSGWILHKVRWDEADAAT